MDKALNSCAESKNPKHQCCMLEVCNLGIQKFGLNYIDIKSWFNKILVYCTSTNPAIKKSALNFLSTMKSMIGDKILKFTAPLEEKLKKIVESELEKVIISTEQPEFELKGANVQIGKNVKTIAEQFPALNLAAKLSQDDINNLSNPNWNLRKNTLDKIISEIQIALFEISHEGVRDVIDVVNRVLQNEKNKSVKKQAITAIQLIGKSLDKEKGKK